MKKRERPTRVRFFFFFLWGDWQQSTLFFFFLLPFGPSVRAVLSTTQIALSLPLTHSLSRSHNTRTRALISTRKAAAAGQAQR